MTSKFAHVALIVVTTLVTLFAIVTIITYYLDPPVSTALSFLAGLPIGVVAGRAITRAY